MMDEVLVSTNAPLPEEHWTDTGVSSAEDTSEGLNKTQILVVIIGLLVEVFSSLALLSMTRCKSVDKRMRVLAQCVTITDIILWCSLMITVCVNNTRLRYIPAACYMNFCLSRTCILLNILVITVLALDRVLCLYFPFKYINFVTTRRVVLLYMAICLVSVVLPIVSIPTKMPDCAMPYQAEGYGVIFLTYLLCVVVIGVSYIGIFKNLMKHIKEMRTMKLPTHMSGRNMYRSTFSFSLIILTFVLCYTPVGIYRATLFFNPELYDVTSGIRRVINLIYVCHSLVNPIIYVWVFPECRLHMIKLMCPCNSKRKEDIDNKIKTISAPFLTA